MGTSINDKPNSVMIDQKSNGTLLYQIKPILEAWAKILKIFSFIFLELLIWTAPIYCNHSVQYGEHLSRDHLQGVQLNTGT